MTTIAQVLDGLRNNPAEHLIRRWNWKSALYSSLCRASIFLAVNLPSGWHAALGAMMAEFIYRAVAAGFYGALTQSFSRVEPRWKGVLVGTAFLISISHSLEFILHWLRGTPNLWGSIAASCAFTLISTLFNLHAMRRGILIAGVGGHSLLTDLRLLPSLFRSERASL